MTWRQRCLGELVAEPLRNGRSVNDRPGGFPVLRLTALRGLRADLDEAKEGDWDRADAVPFIVRAGDFLISRGNGSLHRVAKGALVGESRVEVAFPDTIIRVRPDRAQILPEFLALAWSCQAVRTQVESRARTTAGIYKVSQRDLAAVVLSLPDLNQQRRIVEILEDHLSRLAAGERGLMRAAQLGVALLASLLTETRTGPVVPLTEVAELQGGIQKQPKRAPTENHYPFLRVANVTATGLDLAEVHRVELFGNELTRLRLLKGDLLVVEGNGSASQIGRAAMWDGSIDDCVHQNHLIRVRPRPQILPEYLAAIWNSPAHRRVLTDIASSSSGLHTLSVTKLKTLKIPVPPLDEQARLLERFEVGRAGLARSNQAVQQAQRRSKVLRQAVLAAAFEGKLTGQHTDDEVIEEMAAAR